MKTIILIIFLLLPLKAIAPTLPGELVFTDGGTDPIEQLWRAVCIVESGNDPLALNISEQAVGISQIRECRIRHFNRLTGKDYKLEDCFDPAVSREVFYYFATEDLERTAKRWNGAGWRTEVYWKKIVKHL